jgi:arsenate reductase
MAEAFFRRHFGDAPLTAFSAGSRPATRIHPVVVEVMAEIGIDLSQNRPKSIENFDRCFALATLGCGDVCPHIPALHRIDLTFDDPKSQPPERVRQIRDQIQAFVMEWGKRLIEEFNNNKTRAS